MMYSLAMITPWPDEQSGIADYAYDLVLGLAETDIEIHVYTTSKQRPMVPDNVSVHPLSDFAGASQFDQVVYQMGNCSDFHADMLGVFFDHPGIVHLHDLSLHHLMAFILYRGNKEDYYQVLRYWYGPEVMRAVFAHNNSGKAGFWDSEAVMSVPFFDPVIQQASSVIVHSEFAKQAIGARFPSKPVSVVPQVYRNMSPTAQQTSPRSCFQVGVFGLVQPHKHVDLILESLAECIERRLPIQLHVGGALDQSCEDLLDVAQKLNIEKSVTFHGRLSSQRFLEMMRSADLCISLRYPTMGETSAVVSRAMQLGLPTIVSDVGWYAELPACVKKIPIERRQARMKLASLLANAVADDQQYNEWLRACRKLALNTFAYANVNRTYAKILQKSTARGKANPRRLARTLGKSNAA